MRVDLGYQMNRPFFVIPIPCPSGTTTTTCPAGSLGFQATRLAALAGILQSGVVILMKRANTNRSICLLFVLWMLALPSLRAQEVIDRIVARIENDVILLSDVRLLAHYQLLVDGRSESDAEILDRLIDQWIVRNEATVARTPQPSDADIDRGLQRLQQSFASKDDYQARRKLAGLSEAGRSPPDRRSDLPEQLSRFAIPSFRSGGRAGHPGFLPKLAPAPGQGSRTRSANARCRARLYSGSAGAAWHQRPGRSLAKGKSRARFM